MFNLKDYLKAPSATEPIESMTFAQMLKATGATGFIPDEGVKFGSRLHLYKGDVKVPANRLFAIKLGKTATVSNSIKTKEGFRELVKNHVCYYGIQTHDYITKAQLVEPRPWVSFGKPAELGEQVVFTEADIVDMIGATA